MKVKYFLFFLQKKHADSLPEMSQKKPEILVFCEKNSSRYCEETEIKK